MAHDSRGTCSDGPTRIRGGEAREGVKQRGREMEAGREERARVREGDDDDDDDDDDHAHDDHDYDNGCDDSDGGGGGGGDDDDDDDGGSGGSGDAGPRASPARVSSEAAAADLEGFVERVQELLLWPLLVAVLVDVEARQTGVQEMLQVVVTGTKRVVQAGHELGHECQHKALREEGKGIMTPAQSTNRGGGNHGNMPQLIYHRVYTDKIEKKQRQHERQQHAK